MLQLTALTEASLPTMLYTTAAATLIIAIGYFFITYSPSIPAKAPKLIKSGNLPIVGAMDFFTRRMDFMLEHMRASASGSFSFTIGQYHVVGVSGTEARKGYFDHRELAFSEAYSIMFSGPPSKPPKNKPKMEVKEDDFGFWFQKRLLAMLKKENLNKVLGIMCQDTKNRLLDLANQKEHLTDPFESIYRIVFQLTLRTVGCTEIAEDGVRREKLLHLYEEVEKGATPSTVIFPWLPSPGKIRRTIGGAQIYKMFGDVIKQREKTGHREEDALQFMLDQGDDTLKVITFVLGALFAGQINSGVNAAWILVYLASEPYWLDKVLTELKEACAKAGADTSAPLVDQVSSLNIEQWESCFPTIDYCLKDSIRLQLLGTAFRQNLSGHDVMVGDAHIPNGAVVSYPIDDAHMNPNIYENPEKWDPARYLPDRAEDKKEPHAWVGWGAGRHPCLGMRFAKLEMNVIIALFVAAFDFELSDASGRVRDPPVVDRNGLAATRPKDRPFLKFKLRENGLM